MHMCWSYSLNGWVTRKHLHALNAFVPALLHSYQIKQTKWATDYGRGQHFADGASIFTNKAFLSFIYGLSKLLKEKILHYFLTLITVG